MPSMLRDERLLRRVFRLSLAFKGAFSLLEIIAGVIALFVPQSTIVDVIVFLTREELTEDPQDFVANHLVTAAHALSLDAQRFAAMYLLSHGIVKTWLIVGLLRQRLWYYPVAMAVFAAFIAYQSFRFAVSHSIWLLVLTAVDVLVIVLTGHEFRYLRAARATGSGA